MTFKTISDFNFSGKRVLLRSDLNSELVRGRVILNDRIIESVQTISELKKKGARVVILAHQARPGEKDFISLKQHAHLLNKLTKIKFVNDILGKKAITKITNLKNGEALLLENVRTLKEEFSPSGKNDLVKILAPLFDFYINDAFSVSHRAQTSIVSFPRILPSAMGRVLEKEIKHLNKINLHNSLLLLGGAKIDETLLLLKKSKKVFTSGILALIFLKLRGHKFGFEEKILEKYKKFFPKLRKYANKVIVPIDLAVNVNGKRKDLSLEEFPSNYFVHDIGKKTIEFYKKEITHAKSVFMKGPAGLCESSAFCIGTKELMNAIAQSRAFSVIGGGHTTSAMKRCGINKNKFDYVSLSGGALIEYLAGKKLPGIEALKRGKK